MPIIEIDAQGIPAIVDLTEDEKMVWRKEFGAIRKKEQLAPAAYIDLAVEKLGGHHELAKISHQTTKLIFLIRETAWNIYIQHEQMVCGKALEQLLRTNTETRSILKQMIEHDGLKKINEATNDEEVLDVVSHIIGELSGRIFPFQYELAKSVTQSRRSRAGTAFERVIRHIIDIKGFPCDDQSKAGTHLFEQNGLGKIVDGLLPGLKQYNQHRAKCAILTMKTTLRERWQEVVEELHRTNVPHIYLLTLDDDISAAKLATMKSHNITLVAPDYVQNNSPAIMNLISFEQLFNKDLPHILQWWEGK
jgi:hypothetical protein